MRQLPAMLLAGAMPFVAQATSPPPPSLIVNLSTRLQVSVGDDVGIAGFVIEGSSPAAVVIRARGPSLAQFGLTGFLDDPRLQLFRGPNLLATNDDFPSASNAAEIFASGFAPSDPRESAMLVALQPGAYTAVVAGRAQSAGTAIIEIFRVDCSLVSVSCPGPSRLSNVSSRGRVDTGDGVMIGGFVITGTRHRSVVVRARGPSLAQLGVPGVLSNPMLRIFSGATEIASNDDWQRSEDHGCAVQAHGFAPSDAYESAIYMDLQPGPYTAIVSGFAATTGIGIVEVFDVEAVERRPSC